VKPDPDRCNRSPISFILWATKQRQPARETFRETGALSSNLDLDLPLVQRLAPIVEDLKLAGDWRPAMKVAADAGVASGYPDARAVSVAALRRAVWSLPDSQGRPSRWRTITASRCS